jgi:hypothetical protein
MRTHEIEGWALNTIERVKASHRVEDQRIELKADWPDPQDAARRIAGHGNAARGESFLWVIGVDEDRGVTGATAIDLSRWYPQVESYFDGYAPVMQSVNFSVDGLHVIAMLFETEGRTPFVVKNPAGGYPEFTVPWRGETRLRAAKRDELLRILSPLPQVPSLDVVGAGLDCGVHTETRREIWCIALKVFITPKDNHQIIIPFYRCKGELMFPNQNFNHPFSEIRIKPYSRNAETITATETEAVIKSAGMFVLSAEIAIPNRHAKPGGNAHVTFDLYLANIDQYVPIRETLPICMSNYNRWERGDKVEPVDQFYFGVGQDL